ncbi:helix-turn-helix transcriptional regulator [Ligilactobacillus murinus]|uniref:helix-turn-helix transcriptional regulator n=1 Tax=Ligilactobacillus murinus TaxID=1622 RepID=UPI0028933543|nr:helix-turn-helix transcriptional regulator [Ligilactobacillus murinus]
MRELQSVPPIKLSAARENAGLTQVEAAEKLGISYQTLSRYENNVGSVRLDMLKKMSELYGIPVEFIFFK